MAALPPVKRVGRAVLLSAVLCAIVVRVAFTDFDGIRVKFVSDPVAPIGGVARVAPPADTRINELRPPVAVIVQVQNDADAPQSFAIRVDETTVCTKAVPARSTRRLDCALTAGWRPADPHEVSVQGPPSRWRLSYVELATHHGGSTGVTDLRVVPKDFTRYDRPGWPGAIALFFFYAGLFAVPRGMFLPRGVRYLHRALTGIALMILGVAVLAPAVSPFAILLSLRAVVNWSLLLFLPRLGFVALTVTRVVVFRWSAWIPLVKCVLVVLAVLFTYWAVSAHRMRVESQNDSGLLVIQKGWFDQHPLLKNRDDIRKTLVLKEGGYDGQFMYFALFDPFLRAFRHEPSMYRQTMDAPPYRYSRIGFVFLTRLIAGSHWERYPTTMRLILLGSLGLLALALAFIARAAGASPWWGFLALLVPGFFQSVQVDLPEPLAAATLVAGYWCVVTRRPWLAAALFAASLLVRETGAVFVLLVGAAEWLRGKRTEAIAIVSLAAAPVVAWHLYVGSVLFSDWGWRAFLLLPDDLGLPFGGFARLWSEILGGRYYGGAVDEGRAGLAYPIVLTSGFVLAMWLAVRKPGVVAIAAVAYGAVAVSLNFENIWVAVGNGQRGTYELFVMLALASVAEGKDLGGRLECLGRPPRSSSWVRWGIRAFWTLTAVYVLYGAVDAPFIRDSLINARMW